MSVGVKGIGAGSVDVDAGMQATTKTVIIMNAMI
jgi:hypothetical protein